MNSSAISFNQHFQILDDDELGQRQPHPKGRGRNERGFCLMIARSRKRQKGGLWKPWCYHHSEWLPMTTCLQHTMGGNKNGPQAVSICAIPGTPRCIYCPLTHQSVQGREGGIKELELGRSLNLKNFQFNQQINNGE